MKKALTFIAAVVLMASASFAQPKVLPGRAVKNNPLVKTASTTRTHQAASMLTLPKKAHFAKAAGDTISTFPWEEGFENGTHGWTIIENDNDGICWQLSDTSSQIADFAANYPRTGNACIVAFSFDNFTLETLTPDEWLISPALEIPSGSAFTLSFYDNGTNPQYAAEHYTVHIATSNTPTALGATTPVLEQTLSLGEWVKRTVDLSAYAGQTIYIGFHHFGCTDQFCLGIDDIRVGNSAPDVTLNGPTMAFANEPVTFVAVSSVTNLAWAVDGTAQAETGDTLVYTFTATGTYAVSVTATNAAGVSTSDTLEVTVIECNDITSFPYLLNADVDSLLYCVKIVDADGDGNNWTLASGGLEESYALYSASYASGALTPDNWLILPGMNLPANANDFILSWYEKAYSSSYAADFYSVYICNTGNDTSDFLATTPIYSDSMSADWAKHGISLANYTNQTIYIAFRHYNCTDQWAMMLDNIRVGGPELPELSLTGATEVRINEPYTYTATSDVTPITWIVDNDTLPETGLTMTYTFTTTGSHTVIVSATNIVGTSTDTLSINAIECLAQTLPFESNFAAETTIGFCWDNPNEGWSLGQLQSGDVVVYSESTLYGMFALNPDNWLVTPTLTMPESGDYQIEYEIIGWLDHYTIYIIQGTDTTALFNETLPEDMADFEPRAVLIPNTVTGNFKVAIRHHESLEGYQLILAYLNVKEQGAPSVIVRGPAEIEKGEAATFTAVSGTATSYAWTVDGTAQNTTGNTLTYTFTTTGNHTVSVIASNNFGSSQPATHTVNVYDCNQPITTLPWEEGFEGSTNCWIFNVQDAGSNGFSIATNGQYTYTNMGNSCLVGAYDDYMEIDQWAISMPFTLPASATDATLSWYVRMPGYQGIDNAYELRIAEGTNANPDYFNTVLLSDNGTTDGFEQRSVSLASMAGKTFRFAFRHITPMGGNSTYFDNIKISSNNAGINNVNNINVSIYPNPASDKLNIEGEGIQMVEMFDLNGRSVLTSQRAGQIDLSNLSEGVYVVRVIAADGVRTEKIVKK